MEDKKKDEPYLEFIAEAEEILEVISKNLLTMEESQDRLSPHPDIINAIFRGVHTLKGIAGMMGFNNITELSHTLENMLDAMRMGKLTLTSVVIKLLFESTDMLRKLIENVSKDGNDNIDTSRLLSDIVNILKKKPEAAAAHKLEELDLDASVLKVLTEYENHRLEENLRLGANIFEITAGFSLETFDKDLNQINSMVSGFGEVITTLPSSGASPDIGIEFKLIIGTKEDLNYVTSILSGANVKIREIKYQRKNEKIKSGSEHEEAQAAESPSSVKSLSMTVRVNINRLDRLLNIVGELVLNKAVITHISKNLRAVEGFSEWAIELEKAARTLDKKLNELQEGLMEVRMVPLNNLFDRLTRMARKLSRESGKIIDIRIFGEETELDRLMIEEIADPLMHIVRNAVDHGIETQEERIKLGKNEIGTIKLSATQKGGHVVIEVEDDGSGVDIKRVKDIAAEKGLIASNSSLTEKEAIDLLFAPGFSTSKVVTEVSGRGVGLDVVRKNLIKLNGTIDIETKEKAGTRFIITLPLTLMILKALIVQVADDIFALPINSVSESLMITKRDIQTVERREVIQLREKTLPILRLEDAFDMKSKDVNPDSMYVVVVGSGNRKIGFVVDALLGQQEIVIKSLGKMLSGIQGVAGATELGNRKTVLVLDVAALIEESVQEYKEEVKD
ncbi:MAG: chemotaxis protein CheA [Nitrospirae bacterium]|nr:chemotaxis protein CheA [Nitrospirota bacterium]